MYETILVVSTVLVISILVLVKYLVSTEKQRRQQKFDAQEQYLISDRPFILSEYK